MQDDGLASPLPGASREGGSARQGEAFRLALTDWLNSKGWVDLRPGCRYSWVDPISAEPGYTFWAAVEIEIDREKDLIRKLAHVEPTDSVEAANSGEAKP